jgi:endothelin-converting enzyme/putative endopeptidase
MRKSLFFLTLSLVAVVGALGCGAPVEEADDIARMTAEEVIASVTAAMDPSVEPCEDFYRYACGGWLAAEEIPADRSRWGRGFSLIGEENLAVQRQILEEAAANPSGDPDTARLGYYFATCMDTAKIDAAGVTPLEPALASVEEVNDVESFMAEIGKLYRIGVEPLFSVQIYPDLKNPDLNIIHLGQGGLSLPDRDYYLAEDNKELVEGLRAHIVRMFMMLGKNEEEAKKSADAIVALETALAEISKPRVELRDPEKNYHKIDITGLKELTPQLPWDALLAETGHPDIVDINVSTPEFFEGLEAVIEKTPPETLRAYLRWNVVDQSTSLLTEEIAQANHDFFGKQLAGRKELSERWKRCVRATDGAMGELLGEAFVERRFPGDSKEIAVDMIRKIERALESALPELAWMDAETQGRAVDKMHAISNKIGYPDTWRDYSSLEIGSDSYYANAIAAREFEFHRQMSKIGNAVDRGEWFMSPPMVNAYYNPLFNEIVFPAGIMQPPFFHRDFPAAMNFGGIGMVMGHELTHGFDDTGRKFDPKGRMVEWWEPEVAEKFERAAECIEAQYDGYEIAEGLKLNGKLTLGENIADNGGIKEAYRAYQAWLAENGGNEGFMDDFTDEQLFFIGFAQTWCTLATPEIEQMLATVDTHSHPRYRVNGPVSNFPEFARAFECAEGTPMNPVDKCEVW